jgi:hypothetical protein
MLNSHVDTKHEEEIKEKLTNYPQFKINTVNGKVNFDCGEKIEKKNLNARSCTTHLQSSMIENKGNEWLEKFNNLDICDIPKNNKMELATLITQLERRDSPMLAKIFYNCLWLKGKAKDDFIYSFAKASIEMELDNIFPSEKLDELSKNMKVQPMKEIMTGSILKECGEIIDDKSMEILKECKENYYKMIDSMPQILPEMSNSDADSITWDGWVRGTSLMDPVRQCVNDIISESPNYYSRLSYGYESNLKIASNFLAHTYAYTQLLFRHIIFPGQENVGNEELPKISLIRMINDSEYESLMDGKTAEYDGDSVELKLNKENSQPALSYSMVSPISHPSIIFGNHALYMKAPVYAILNDLFAHRRMAF